MPATARAVHHQRLSPAAGVEYYHEDHCYSSSPDKDLYVVLEHECGRSLIPLPAKRNTCADQFPAIGTALRPLHQRRPSRAPRPLMATLTFTPSAHAAFDGPPGSPPDLTNSKSSKSSSFHSSTLSDFMGPSDLSHFEEIDLNGASTGPSSFPLPASSSHRIVYEAPKASLVGGRSLSHPHPAQHSFRDLTNASRPRYPSLKGQIHHAVQRQQAQLAAPGKQLRRGFSSPSAPSLTNMNLSAPSRSSRSPSPSNVPSTSAARTLSRRSSRNLDVLPSPGLTARRQSWQDSRRKSVKEREAECDDEDDELPEDAVIWNIPISPRPAQERSPALSTCDSPTQTSPVPSATSAPSSSRKTSPAPSLTRSGHSPQPRSPHPLTRENSPTTQLARQRTSTWEDTYTSLDNDAKRLTEALEEFQSEYERKQVVTRQQPGLTRSVSLSQSEPKQKRSTLPPVRKSDPLIDPFQPSAEKQKYLSRTRPSWLPPKDPKEEKKHLKEYAAMLARVEEAERQAASRAAAEAASREQASRLKSDLWSTHLLPNWTTEMADPDRRAAHRKMWWNGIPPRLRGEVWQRAVGNELGVTETTYGVALKKAQRSIERGDPEMLARRDKVVEATRSVFPEIKMFAPSFAALSTSPSTTSPSTTTQDHTTQPQPLHADLLSLTLAYLTYRPDHSPPTTHTIPHLAGLLLLSLPPSRAFILLANLLNRPLPLAFLLQDGPGMHAAYLKTLSALSKKSPLLAARIRALRVEPAAFLARAFASLFACRLELEAVSRVLDVYVFEGDKTLIRAALVVCGAVEGRCLEGSSEEVGRVLGCGAVGGGEEEFVGKLWDAGKVD